MRAGTGHVWCGRSSVRHSAGGSGCCQGVVTPSSPPTVQYTECAVMRPMAYQCCRAETVCGTIDEQEQLCLLCVAQIPCLEAVFLGLATCHLSSLPDLLLKPDTPVALRRFFNTIAEEPDVVARFVVPRMLNMREANSEVRYLQFLDAFVRVVGGVPAILWGGRYFDKDGNRVGDGEFNEAGVRKLY